MKKLFCDHCAREIVATTKSSSQTPMSLYDPYEFLVTDKGKEYTILPFFHIGRTTFSLMGASPSCDLCVDCARYLCGKV